MTSFNTKIFGKGLYRLEFETDDREKYLRMQKLARAIVDQEEACTTVQKGMKKMLTNEDIIEKYGNHPGTIGYREGIPKEHIMCENCPVYGKDCRKYGSTAPCGGKNEAYARIRRYLEEAAAEVCEACEIRYSEDKK